MGFFPPNMYDPQINMIRKPFVLNKEKLRQDLIPQNMKIEEKNFL
jgi:hypothetical protein